MGMQLPFGEKRDGVLYGNDILSVKQFSIGDLKAIFGVADEMRTMVERVGSFDLLKGKVMTALFYEPSTRTSSSWAPCRAAASSDCSSVTRRSGSSTG